MWARWLQLDKITNISLNACCVVLYTAKFITRYYSYRFKTKSFEVYSNYRHSKFHFNIVLKFTLLLLNEYLYYARLLGGNPRRIFERINSAPNLYVFSWERQHRKLWNKWQKTEWNSYLFLCYQSTVYKFWHAVCSGYYVSDCDNLCFSTVREARRRRRWSSTRRP